jgi:hypothetical protein
LDSSDGLADSYRFSWLNSPSIPAGQPASRRKSSEPQTLQVLSRRGENKTFDVSPEACKEFGFLCGDRVKTPKGNAWVVGMFGGNLYFQVDGDTGASKWSGFTKETFAKRGFSLIHRPTLSLPKMEKYSAPSLLPLVNNQEFSDVVFILDSGDNVYAMKGILVSRSSYFQALFTNKTEEKDSKEIQIRGVDRTSFCAILTYLYTGHVEISKENCSALLKAADMFLVEDIKLMCAQELITQVTNETVLDILYLSEQRGLTKLKAFCLKFLIANLDDPTLHAAFKQNFICKQTGEITMELIDYLRKKNERKSKKRRRDGFSEQCE